MAKFLYERDITLVWSDPPYGMKCQKKDGKIGGGGSRKLSKHSNSFGGGNYDSKTYLPVAGTTQLKQLWHHLSCVTVCFHQLCKCGGERIIMVCLPPAAGWCGISRTREPALLMLSWRGQTKPPLSESSVIPGMGWLRKGKKVTRRDVTPTKNPRR